MRLFLLWLRKSSECHYSVREVHTGFAKKMHIESRSVIGTFLAASSSTYHILSASQALQVTPMPVPSWTQLWSVSTKGEGNCGN